MSLPNGYIIYRGPSLLNGAPIVAVVIAMSTNPKTGPMSQAYILADNGDRPVEATQNGADVSICGDCKHRPRAAGTCYVVVRQGATRVYKSLTEGRYADLSHCPDLAAEILAGRHMRLGAYGDPAAVPATVWMEFVASLSGWVGYTHQWRNPVAQPLRALCMASVDTASERDLAIAMGWRPFRVRRADEPVARTEAVCPASEEGARKLTCTTCGYCNGTGGGRRGGVSILLHGNHMRDREQRFRVAQEALAG